MSHPLARRISFTGSPETARSIGRAAAANIVPFTGELGGKGPLLVFEDADLEEAAKRAAGMYDDAGQVCLAGTRLIVQESVAPRFRELVRGRDRPSTSSATRVIRRRRSRRSSTPTTSLALRASSSAAREAGDTIAFGGRRSELGGEKGLWYEPTLIEPRSNDSEVVQREVFGPVLTWQTFADEEDGVALANSTSYGLSAIICTGFRRAG